VINCVEAGQAAAVAAVPPFGQLTDVGVAAAAGEAVHAPAPFETKPVVQTPLTQPVLPVAQAVEAAGVVVVAAAAQGVPAATTCPVAVQVITPFEQDCPAWSAMPVQVAVAAGVVGVVATQAPRPLET
jgi:hypothetical protein